MRDGGTQETTVPMVTRRPSLVTSLEVRADEGQEESLSRVLAGTCHRGHNEKNVSTSWSAVSWVLCGDPCSRSSRDARLCTQTGSCSFLSWTCHLPNFGCSQAVLLADRRLLGIWSSVSYRSTSVMVPLLPPLSWISGCFSA